MSRKSPAASAVQLEIKQTRPFASRAQEATVALLRTADLVRRRVGQTLEPHGLTLSQYNVLRILRGAGVEGLPTLEIAARMIEETPGITRLLDRLEAKGLVRRVRCERDRRQVLCWATPAALELLARLDEPVLKADEEGLGLFSAGELEELVRLLDTVRGARPNPPATGEHGKAAGTDRTNRNDRSPVPRTEPTTTNRRRKR